MGQMMMMGMMGGMGGEGGASKGKHVLGMVSSFFEGRVAAKTAERKAELGALMSGVDATRSMNAGRLQALAAQEESNASVGSIVASGAATGMISGTNRVFMEKALEVGTFNADVAMREGEISEAGHLARKAGYEAQAKEARKDRKNVWKKILIHHVTGGVGGKMGEKMDGVAGKGGTDASGLPSLGSATARQRSVLRRFSGTGSNSLRWGTGREAATHF